MRIPTWIESGHDPDDPVAERYDEARAALLATNPPSLDRECAYAVLRDIADDDDPIPRGDDILTMVFEREERAAKGGRS